MCQELKQGFVWFCQKQEKCVTIHSIKGNSFKRRNINMFRTIKNRGSYQTIDEGNTSSISDTPIPREMTPKPPIGDDSSVKLKDIAVNSLDDDRRIYSIALLIKLKYSIQDIEKQIPANLVKCGKIWANKLQKKHISLQAIEIFVAEGEIKRNTP